MIKLSAMCESCSCGGSFSIDIYSLEPDSSGELPGFTFECDNCQATITIWVEEVKDDQ